MGPEETSAPGRAGCRQRRDAAQRRLLGNRGPGEGGAQGAEEGSAARAVVAGPRAASVVGAVEMDKNHTKGLGESENGLPGAPQGARSKGALWRTPASTPSAPPPAPPLSRSPPTIYSRPE